jgi:exopolysaccharide biosynthesis predicted pyruvyltransferase EpsI
MLVSAGWEDLDGKLLEVSAQGGTLRFVPNHGNAGDALIAAGAWQTFDRLGLRPVMSSIDGLQTGDVALYPGGGNLVPAYEDCRMFLERCLTSDVRAAFVLPCTVRGHRDILARLDRRFFIACRDLKSLEFVRDSGTGAQVIAAPDLALRLDVDVLKARCARVDVRVEFWRHIVATRRTSGYLSWRAVLSALQVPRDGTMHILRTDVESVQSVPGRRRWDISGLYVSKFQTRVEAEVIARDFLAFVARAKRVRTNRLHAGIAAALVGRPVTFVDNSYGKIRDIYETSLKDHPSIVFASS